MTARERAAKNTDRELWRETPDDYSAPSLHVTENGSISMNVGGTVIVLPIREWHRLATLGMRQVAEALGALPAPPRAPVAAGEAIEAALNEWEQRSAERWRQAPSEPYNSDADRADLHATVARLVAQERARWEAGS